MLPKARSRSFVLFSLLFVLTLTDPPRTGKYSISWYIFFNIPVGSAWRRRHRLEAAGQADRPAG